MTTKIKSCEADIPDTQLLRRRVKGRLQDGNPIVLEHMKQGGLARVIEAEEEELCAQKRGVFRQKPSSLPMLSAATQIIK